MVKKELQMQMPEFSVPPVLSRIAIVVTYRQEGRSNLSHEGVNPAQVPY